MRSNIGGYGLLAMAGIVYGGFYIYYKISGDVELLEVGRIVGGMLLALAALGFVKIRPWR